LAQQVLSEDGQQALYNGEMVDETLTNERVPVRVRAVRLDRDIVIKLRNARSGPPLDETAPLKATEPVVDEIALALEEEPRAIKERAAAGPPPLPTQPEPQPEPEPEIDILLDEEEPAVAEGAAAPAEKSGSP